MSINTVFPTSPLWTDKDGYPLEAGYIYVGLPGLEAKSSPKASFFDPEMTIPTGTAIGAAVRTTAGYVSYNGGTSPIYVDGDYSLTVTDRYGVTCFSALHRALIYSDVPGGGGSGPVTQPVTLFRETFAQLALITPEQLAINAFVQTPFGLYQRATPPAHFDYTGTGGVALNFVTPTGEASVKAWGGLSNSASDLTPVLLGIWNAGFVAVVPPPVGGTWVLNTPLTGIPVNAALWGLGKRQVKINKNFSGDLGTVGDGMMIDNIHIADDSASFTGAGLSAFGVTGNFVFNNVRITGMDGPCFYRESTAAGNSKFTDCTFIRRSSATGTGRYAVVTQNVFSAAAVPTHWVNFSSEGNCSFDHGGANDCYIVNSTLADMSYTTNSVAVKITGSRILNAPSLTLFGNGHGIVNCQVLPQITIGAGSDNNAICSNGYNALPVIDNSGNGRNLVDHWAVAYVPTLTAAGTPPSLGNGSLIATFSRSGATVSVDIELTIGSTTTLGSGDLRVSLPTAALYSGGLNIQAGMARMVVASTNYVAGVHLNAGDAFVTFSRDTSGPVTFNSPATWVAGNTLRAHIEYAKG